MNARFISVTTLLNALFVVMAAFLKECFVVMIALSNAQIIGMSALSNACFRDEILRYSGQSMEDLPSEEHVLTLTTRYLLKYFYNYIIIFNPLICIF